MSRHSARLWRHLGVLALSLSLLGCGPTLPPAQTPDAPLDTRSEMRPVRDSGETAIPRAFSMGTEPAPLQMRSDAPPPEAQPQGNTLTQPDQPPLSLGDLQGGLPNKIPQGMAGSLLRPLDQGAMAYGGAPGLAPNGPDGCTYGALPDLVDYGVYPRLLYYNFQSCWVPYILLDDFYYPYVYQPYFDPLFTGYCYYPLFIFRGGFYYPYYFHSRSYYYGYLDWEYNWPRYRDRHSDYDWGDIGRRRLRRYNQDDFEHWRDGKIRRRDREDWQRVEPPRRNRARNEAQERQVERPEVVHGEAKERKIERPEARGESQERQIERPDARGEDPERLNKRQAGKKAERVASKVGMGRLKAERSPQKATKQEKREGRKAKGERRAQSEDEEAQEQLD